MAVKERILVPDFILDQFQKDNFKGYFNGWALSVDISGFTQLTDTLMSRGKEGAEILSDIFRAIFGNTIQTVREYGGFISALPEILLPPYFHSVQISRVVVSRYQNISAFTEFTVYRGKK